MARFERSVRAHEARLDAGGKRGRSGIEVVHHFFLSLSFSDEKSRSERERERESYVPLSLSPPSRSSLNVPYLARSFTSARVIIYHERAFVNSNNVYNYYS